MTNVRRRIGVLGGTFDPIHVGHIALARSAQVALGFDEIRFLPTGISWQKSDTATPASDRLEMVRLAVAGRPGFVVDDREVRRAGNSYTVDTLQELRREVGDHAMLVLLLGSDQLRNLATWHRYRELLQHAHIAVTRRERVSLARLPEAVEALVEEHGCDALPDRPGGSIVFFGMPFVPVSATRLREQLLEGDRPAELLPGVVLDYIDRHGLYRPAPPAHQKD
jgi:nicotinate-nucleotide adenylyltransferase